MEVRREPDEDAEEIVRRRADDWDDVQFIMTGTSDAVDGDGLTQSAESLQPGENGTLEIVVDGECIARILGSRGCPRCDGNLYRHTQAPGAFWCDECELEYHKDGGEWYSCDASGELERVQACVECGSQLTDEPPKSTLCEGCFVDGI